MYSNQNSEKSVIRHQSQVSGTNPYKSISSSTAHNTNNSAHLEPYPTQYNISSSRFEVASPDAHNPTASPVKTPNMNTPYPLLDVYFQFFTCSPQQEYNCKENKSSAAATDRTSKLSSGMGGESYWDCIKMFQQSKDFLEGMLLHSVDYKPRYPYIHYIITKSRKRNGDCFFVAEKDSFIKGHAYSELQTFIDRSMALLPKRPSNPNAAYIVTSFKTLTSSHILANNWTYWSGANYIVESVPKSLKLERMTFHQTLQTDGCEANGSDEACFTYILICELGEGLKDINKTREFVDSLKYRQCGLTSLYAIDHFF